MRQRFGTTCLFGMARVAHRLPWSWAIGLGRAAGCLAPMISARHLRRVMEDIALAFPGMPQAEVRDIAGRMYQTLGRSLIEFLRLRHQSPDHVRRWLSLHGREHLDAALDHGKGVVLIGGHMGNWELCGTALCLHGYRLSAITRAQRDTGLTALINQTRNRHGLTVLDMEDLRQALRVLKRNECLGNICDLNARKPGAFVNFLGRPAATYTGAAFFALATGARVVPGYDEPQPDGTHIVRMHPEIPMINTGDRARDIFYNTIRIHHAIADEVRKRPHDWYWLVRRWQTRPEEIAEPDSVPMEHRDLTPDEVARILDYPRQG